MIVGDDSFHYQMLAHHLFLKFLELLSMIQRWRFVETVLVLGTSGHVAGVGHQHDRQH